MRLAYGAAVAFSLLVLWAFGPFDQKLGMIGHDDFANIWAGPRAFLAGHDPYDPVGWRQSAAALGTPSSTDVYLYPPWVVVALLPVAALPLRAASLLWTTVGIALAVVAVGELARRLLPARPAMHAAVAVTLLLSGSALSTLLTGQWTFVLVAAMAALVTSLRSGRPVTAGVLSLAMLMKPQLFLYAAPALALRAVWPASPRERRAGVRFVLTSTAAAAALVGVSWILMPSWLPNWPERIGRSQLTTDSVTLPGLLFRTLGTSGLVLGALLLLAAVIAGLAFHPRSAGWLPMWITISIAATPYSNPYDLLLLLVPIVMATGVLATRSPRRAGAVFALGIGILLAGQTLLHDLALLAYAPLVPAAVLVLLTLGLWRRRREIGVDA